MKEHAALQIDKLNIRYGQLEVVRSINLNLKKEEVVCLLGPNGCGKSSLLQAIIGLTPYQGFIFTSTAKIDFVSQNPSIMLLPWLTNKQNIVFPSSIKEIDERLLEELLEFRNNYPYELSGGMAQLVLLTRALLHHSSLILLDEPFKSLDFSIAKNLYKKVRDLFEKYTQTVLFVSHNIDEALFLADRIIVLSEKPTQIKKEILVPFGNERELGILNSVHFSELRKEVLNECLH